MPTTILHNETLAQAYARRFAEERPSPAAMAYSNGYSDGHNNAPMSLPYVLDEKDDYLEGYKHGQQRFINERDFARKGGHLNPV